MALTKRLFFNEGKNSNHEAWHNGIKNDGESKTIDLKLLIIYKEPTYFKLIAKYKHIQKYLFCECRPLWYDLQVAMLWLVEISLQNHG